MSYCQGLSQSQYLFHLKEPNLLKILVLFRQKRIDPLFFFPPTRRFCDNCIFSDVDQSAFLKVAKTGL